MYNYYSQDFEINIKYSDILMYDNRRRIADKYNWFHKNTLSDEWLHYLANSSEHKNNLRLYKRVINANLQDSRSFMIEAFGVLQLIEETQSGQKVKIETICAKVIGPITSFKMNPLHENIPRSNLDLIATTNKFQIFKNETSGPVEFRDINSTGDEKRIKKNHKTGGGYTSLASGESFMRSMPTGLRVMIYDINGDCIGFHVTTKENSIILIE